MKVCRVARGQRCTCIGSMRPIALRCVHIIMKTAHITTLGRTLITMKVVNPVCTPLLQVFNVVWIRESFLDTEEEPDL